MSPVVDMTSHKCYFCGDLLNVRLCEACSKYACRDCTQAVTEEGCYHKPKNIITSQKWD